MIAITAYTPADRDALLRFHAASFGPSSYQAKTQYLTWLYEENPARCPESCGWIARNTAEKIVGCLHVMPFASGPGAAGLRIHTLHNLIVDEAVRGGVGMVLVKRALRGADITVFPGVAPELAKTYRAIRYEEVQTFWGRRILSPIGAGAGRALAKIGVERKVPRALQARLTETQATARSVLETLAEHLNAQTGNQLLWTADTVRWRFFSENGPRHLLFIDSARADAFCILSIGMRHNLCVARPVAFGSDIALMREAIAEAKSLGVDVLLGFASTGAGQSALETLRFAPVPKMPTSFLKRSAKAKSLGAFHLTAACTDIGFESIG